MDAEIIMYDSDNTIEIISEGDKEQNFTNEYEVIVLLHKLLHKILHKLLCNTRYLCFLLIKLFFLIRITYLLVILGKIL